MAFDATRCGVSLQTCWEGYAAGSSVMGDELLRLYAATRQASIGKNTGTAGPRAVAAPLPALANYDGAAQLVYLAPLTAATGGNVQVVQTMPAASSTTAEYGTAVQQLAPLATSLTLPSANSYQQAAPVVSSLTGADGKPITLGQVLQGAASGAGQVLMQTPQGQELQNQMAWDYVNSKGLLIGSILAVVVGFVVWLVTRNSRR